MPDLDAVLRVLHDLIDIAHGHGLAKDRADELHDILKDDRADPAPADSAQDAG